VNRVKGDVWGGCCHLASSATGKKAGGGGRGPPRRPPPGAWVLPGERLALTARAAIGRGGSVCPLPIRPLANQNPLQPADAGVEWPATPARRASHSWAGCLAETILASGLSPINLALFRENTMNAHGKSSGIVLLTLAVALFGLEAAAQPRPAPTSQPAAGGQTAEQELAAAKAEYEKANTAFQAKLASNAEYVAAKKSLDAAVAALDSPQGDRAKAATEKMEAAKALADTVKELQMADPEMGKVMRRLEAASQRGKAEKQAKRDSIQKGRDQRILDYKMIVARLKAKDAKFPTLAKSLLVGDETNVATVKVKPKDYLDKPFLICGGVKLNDYYNFGYSNAKATHYSLDFWPMNAKGRYDRDFAHLYQVRTLGDDVVDVLANLKASGEGGTLPMRFKVTVSSGYAIERNVRAGETVDLRDYSRRMQEAISKNDEPEIRGDMYEVVDWQFYDFVQNQWGPWHSEATPASKAENSGRAKKPK